MAKTRRDDFPQSKITKLRDRVVHRCSNPACRVPTSGPTQDDPEKTVNIGKAAHICAAAPGGPRYDSTMTKEQRKGINNAIWLCGGCADRIDKDAKAFPVELLKQWKADAERTASEELNTKLSCKEDAGNLLSTVLTASPKSVSVSAIGNVCKAASKSLEELDSRFSVQASFYNNKTEFKINAKETVNLKLKVKKPYGEEFTRKFDELTKHGRSLEIDAEAVMFEGSGLLEFITSEAKRGKFSIASGLRKPAVQKFSLRNRETNETFYVDDFHGEITGGKESLSFSGKTFGGLLTMEYTSKISPDKKDKFNFSLSLDTTLWESLPLNSLPYFDKVHDLFRCLTDNWELNISLEIDGRRLLAGISPEFDPHPYNGDYYGYCDFIFLARSVLKHFGKTGIYKTDFEYTEQLHETLFLINKLLNDEIICIDDFTMPSSVFRAAKDLANIKFLLDPSDPKHLKMEHDHGGILTLFGENIQLPKTYIVFTSVVPVLDRNVEDIKPGDDVIVKWVPQEDCKLIAGFLNDTQVRT